MLDNGENKITPVHFLQISADDSGQRIDNFIRKNYPGIPKSRIYNMLRRGEARLNGKRISANTRINAGDNLRLPPIFHSVKEKVNISAYWQQQIAAAVIYEDDDFLILNKPTGIAVHGGSGVDFALVDIVAAVWGKNYAQLAHRLDYHTSGCLLFGKNRRALNAFSALCKVQQIEKKYLALVDNQWQQQISNVFLHLNYEKLASSKIVSVCDKNARGARHALTEFTLIQQLANCALIQATLKTGRTHQIRASLRHLGYAIAGDEKYGKQIFNRFARSNGYRGLFLHAHFLAFNYNERQVVAHAPLNAAQRRFLQILGSNYDR